MKQIFTILLFVVAFATQSFAVNSTVVPATNAETNLTIDIEQNTGFFKKAKMFVAKKINKIKKALGADDDKDLLMILLIWFCSPIAMYLYEGKQWTGRVTLNLILYLLCGLPGIIHAAIVIFGKK